jgi:hypothetical protein
VILTETLLAISVMRAVLRFDVEARASRFPGWVLAVWGVLWWWEFWQISGLEGEEWWSCEVG